MRSSKYLGITISRGGRLSQRGSKTLSTVNRGSVIQIYRNRVTMHSTGRGVVCGRDLAARNATPSRPASSMILILKSYLSIMEIVGPRILSSSGSITGLLYEKNSMNMKQCTCGDVLRLRCVGGKPNSVHARNSTSVVQSNAFSTSST